ncbi:UDP-N-acetylenolpyruvoylglucosamine reductase [Zhongshania aliphaticivorans]|uniref:UDP-N-acetylenolpyruvoylglucosamine reductase n=1 Tax=Zhongshania aliphaticivorans TaxID=1470434 RepID=A0A5S9NFY1_9GAMM|nr:UDP-N-acetylmuramate dehydrogenase [Zhongshania aliphaticivorans]CAA0088431.1 UDP-N-acetylenolpyruvoylglucosamine reductase [Zhongshania aliphaticivorans]CAA0120517.1 UDP-N-acetylenolpyruvoylglucosamine reductase [Zhongshania aliphaticivorans]
MSITPNVTLQGMTTLDVPVKAAYVAEVSSLDDLKQALLLSQKINKPPIVIGGGSNVVFTKDVDGVLIRILLRGISCTSQGDDRLIEVAAGENWHDLVCHCLAQGWYGLENLISIPGSVGAAPIQNIGAYGIELASVLESVTGWDCEQQAVTTLSAGECHLGYRDSIFKNELRDRFIITSVTLRLSVKAITEVSYPALRAELLNPDCATPDQIAQAVAAIRAAKLPDYRDAPNAGSFFKNPFVSAAKAKELVNKYPNIAHWPTSGGAVKLAAAWLVDQAGWKGRREGGVGIHPRQAIVLVNYGGVNGKEIIRFAGQIQADIMNKYGVQLEIEPRVY